MHSFHFTLVVVYIYCIADLSGNAASVIFPVHRPLIYYSLRLRRGCHVNLSLLWEQCIAAYLKEVFYAHSGSAHTIKNYSGILRRFFAHHSKPPELCTREDVIDFIAMPTPRGSPPSHSTRNLRLNVIRGFYRHAARFVVYDGYGRPYRLFQGENPAEGLRRAKIEHKPNFLTEEEVKRFFSAIPQDTVRGLRDRCIFLFYLTTARRLSEVTRLTWGDIAFGTVNDERGSKPGWTYRFTGKGRGEQPDVAELPEVARLALWEYLEASGRMETIEPDDPLFIGCPNPKGGGMPIDPYKSISGGNILRLAIEYAQMAGIDRVKMNVHIWRHKIGRASCRERV